MAIVIIGIAVDSTFDSNLFDLSDIAGLLIIVVGVLILLYAVVGAGGGGETDSENEVDENRS